MGWISDFFSLFRKSDCSDIQIKLDACQARNANQASIITDLQDANEKLRKGIETQETYPHDTTNVVLKDGAWVRGVLRKYNVQFKRLPMDGGTIKDWYRVPPLEDTIKWIEWDRTDERKYTMSDSFTFDCDKFARIAWARLVSTTNGAWNFAGFVDDFSGAHAYLLFLTPEGELMGYEPQNDKIWEWDTEDMKGMYDAESGYVLI